MYVGERFNSISHLIGAAAALAGTIILIVLAARDGDPWKLVSFSVYGTTLVALYTFSTLYHSLRGEAKRIFRRLDHQTIYLLIAGTYIDLHIPLHRTNEHAMPPLLDDEGHIEFAL